jgi:hypothetical protein
VAFGDKTLLASSPTPNWVRARKRASARQWARCTSGTAMVSGNAEDQILARIAEMTAIREFSAAFATEIAFSRREMFSRGVGARVDQSEYPLQRWVFC